MQPLSMLRQSEVESTEPNEAIAHIVRDTSLIHASLPNSIVQSRPVTNASARDLRTPALAHLESASQFEERNFVHLTPRAPRQGNIYESTDFGMKMPELPKEEVLQEQVERHESVVRPEVVVNDRF
jgi:hypothetical protein